MSIRRFITILFLGFMMRLELAACADRTCNLILSEHNREQVANLGICTRKLNYKTGVEKVQKSMCILKCTMERQGLISEDGSIKLEVLEKYIAKKFPKSLQSRAARMFTPCFKEVPAATQIAASTDCKVYEPFIKCISRTYPQLCRNEPQQHNNIRPQQTTGAKIKPK